jgi:thiol-disulfide isomerase/thioredoxin
MAIPAEKALGLVAATALSAFIIIGAAWVAGAFTDRDAPPAPDFDAQVWLNSPPLRIAELRGKVVLVDFWEYTCINCVRTFPYLKRWHQLYGPLGLVVIGVHTPEFKFGKDPARVADAAKRFGFTFPIAVDSDARIWRAYNNDAWPSKYLIDKDGRIVLNHLGEGGYAEFERHIQELLKQANPRLDFAQPKFGIAADDSGTGAVCQRPTPEIYLGSARGDRIANDGGYSAMTSAAYREPNDIPADRFALAGNWIATPEFVQHAAKSSALTDFVALNYRAKSLYLVAGSDHAKPAQLLITQDGRPLPQSARGVDVKAGSNGRTYIELGGKRMYYVVNNAGFEQHLVRLYPAAPGVSLYSFTFGNECENAFEHR